METDRAAIIKLFQAGHKRKEILNLLEMPNGRRMFVYRTIKRYQETGTVEDRVRSGRPSSVMISYHSQGQKGDSGANSKKSPAIHEEMALGMEISRRSVARIVKNDLGMKSLNRKKMHFLTPQIREKRKVRSKGLLERHAVYGKIQVRMLGILSNFISLEWENVGALSITAANILSRRMLLKAFLKSNFIRTCVSRISCR